MTLYRNKAFEVKYEMMGLLGPLKFKFCSQRFFRISVTEKVCLTITVAAEKHENSFKFGTQRDE